MHITAYMLSCAERSSIREQTVASLGATDWNENPSIYVNECTHGDRLERMAIGVFQLLQRAIADESEMILFIEDDVRFNRYLRHNLKRWLPLAGVSAHDMFFGSLFNPNIPAIERYHHEAYFVADAKYVLGSQALIFSLASACHLIDHWDELDDPPDYRMARLSGKVCSIYYHTPSLVQRVGRSSTWGGPYFRADDFRSDWKAHGVEYL
jgi:hypothetical protein